MTHEQILELLDDYVGGELAPRDERDVRRHLMQCESCRAEEEVLRTLLDEAAALPEEIAPPRDLWQDIAPRLESRTAVIERSDEVRIGRKVRPVPWWMLAAASVALVATTALATLQISGGDDTPVLAAEKANAPMSAGGPPTALAAFRPAEQEYERAISDLQVLLETQRGTLAPQTVATLETNLKVIDKAIQESRAALAADPNSAELARMLSQSYDAKLGVLKRAISL